MAFIRADWIFDGDPASDVWVNTDRILYIERSAGKTLVHFAMDDSPDTRLLLDLSPEEFVAAIGTE